MEQVLRVNNTDQRITYNDDWKITPISGLGQNGSYSYASTSGAYFFLMFRGTSVSFYGRIGGGGNVQFRLDGNIQSMPLNDTNFDSGPKLVWNTNNLKDGDHQLYVYVTSLQQNGSIAVDYLEIENSSGNGFDTLWAGPNATNVPEEAIIVDNTSPDVVFSDPSMWSSGVYYSVYNKSVSYTTQAGASLSFSFDGIAIWYYGSADVDHGFYTVSIDGSEPERLNSKNDGGQLTQQMLWSNANLTPGRHTFTLKQDDLGGKYTSLDFFRVLRANNTSALPSSTPASTDAITAESITPQSKSNIVPLAVGLTFGLLTLVIVVLGAFYLQRRRRRKSSARARRRTLLDTYTTPLHHIPPAQDGQLLGAPQESKRRSQPPGSTPYAGAPTAKAVPTMFTSIPESEMAPSHETCEVRESGPA